MISCCLRATNHALTHWHPIYVSVSPKQSFLLIVDQALIVWDCCLSSMRKGAYKFENSFINWSLCRRLERNGRPYILWPNGNKLIYIEPDGVAPVLSVRLRPFERGWTLSGISSSALCRCNPQTNPSAATKPFPVSLKLTILAPNLSGVKLLNFKMFISPSSKYYRIWQYTFILFKCFFIHFFYLSWYTAEIEIDLLLFFVLLLVNYLLYKSMR